MDKEIQINGVSLIDRRWNIQYIPEGMPKKRGSNLTIPYADGEKWVKKNFEARSETLNMWVLPFDETGRIPQGKTAREQLEENIDYLKGLFGFSGLAEYR